MKKVKTYLKNREVTLLLNAIEDYKKDLLDIYQYANKGLAKENLDDLITEFDLLIMKLLFLKDNFD